MDKQTKGTIFYIISLLCGLWFFVFGTSWCWLMALLFAYPPGIIGIRFWYLGKKYNPHSKLKNIALGLLLIALIVSVTAFILISNNIWWVPTIMGCPD